MYLVSRTAEVFGMEGIDNSLRSLEPLCSMSQRSYAPPLTAAVLMMHELVAIAYYVDVFFLINSRMILLCIAQMSSRSDFFIKSPRLIKTSLFFVAFC